jgi:glutamyl-tRNA synthetase
VSIRGRFAPSPTGHLHLGNARTALLGWLQVRSQGGSFIIRVEDLDVGRVRAEFREAQIRDLRWLGLDWDEGPDVGGEFGPYLQSSRASGYEQALNRLRRKGLVYQCRCTRREIAAAASAPHIGDDEAPAYPGTCRTRPAVEPDTGVALRFRVPTGPVPFIDELQGQRSYNPSAETGDFVIRRKDGIAAYQLAVAVDDAAMKVTHVLRGADLLSSTARQILIYEALELPPPRWLHVPLMLEAEGERLSKRGGGLSLGEIRGRGIAPERIVGWLAFTCGLVDRQSEAVPNDLIGSFDPQRIARRDTRVALPEWLIP